MVWADLVEDGQVVYCNPPYYPTTLLGQFLERCVDTSVRGVAVTALIPASPCAGWWIRWVDGGGGEVDFLPGRLAYDGPFASGGVAPFGAALVHWPARNRELAGGTVGMDQSDAAPGGLAHSSGSTAR